MLTLLFGVDVLISGWITAILLAILLAFFFGQTRIIQSIFQSFEATANNRFHQFYIHCVARLVVVAVPGIILAALLSLEPDPDSGLAVMFKLVPQDPGQTQNRFIFDDIAVTFIVLSLLLFTTVTNRLYASLYRRIENWGHYHFRTIRIQKLNLLTRAQIAAAMIQVVKTTRYALLFLISATSLLLILSLYQLTSGIAHSIFNQVAALWLSLWDSVRAILPNLLMLIAISLLTRLVLKFMGFLYDAIWRGKIKVDTLHHELVEPTYQLLRLLVIAFALVAAFPYIPGSSSPVFKAISIFVGFLLSLGSTSLASNIVSGIVLTYTRGLRVGDRVQVADAVGDVIDRTLLVTRIRTIKNVVITLPNSMVMQNKVNNFTAEAEANGLVLHTTVTIGYDVPWRQVDHLLIQAALKTPDILNHPPPFVLKTSLDDWYISYELNAYTDRPERMAVTYSTLHEHILDEFNRGGVEIMSPTYFAVRDGNPVTIPNMEKTRKNGGESGNNGHGKPEPAARITPADQAAQNGGRTLS